MPAFVELACKTGLPIVVNMDRISWMTPESEGKGTLLSDGSEGTIHVTETLDEIRRKMPRDACLHWQPAQAKA